MTGGNSIRLFQRMQQYCQTIGIPMLHTNQNRHSLNTKNFIFAICLAQGAMASAAFLVSDAKSMSEYGATFFSLICVIKATLDYFILNWKLDDVLKFIKTCERFIEKSK